MDSFFYKIKKCTMKQTSMCDENKELDWVGLTVM